MLRKRQLLKIKLKTWDLSKKWDAEEGSTQRLMRKSRR
jgi:hypothetical protein